MTFVLLFFAATATAITAAITLVMSVPRGMTFVLLFFATAITLVMMYVLVSMTSVRMVMPPIFVALIFQMIAMKSLVTVAAILITMLLHILVIQITLL